MAKKKTAARAAPPSQAASAASHAAAPVNENHFDDQPLTIDYPSATDNPGQQFQAGGKVTLSEVEVTGYAINGATVVEGGNGTVVGEDWTLDFDLPAAAGTWTLEVEATAGAAFASSTFTP